MSNAASTFSMATEKLSFVKKEFIAKSEYYVNIRENEPNSDANVCALLKPGENISIVGYVTNGEKIRNNSRWYKTTDGHYVWAGFIDGVTNL